MLHPRRELAALAFLTLLAAPIQALAWGNSGHRIIGRLTIQSLPPELPAFLRAPSVAVAVGELSREPDWSRGAGKVHDDMRDGQHFVDVDDNGKVQGGPALDALPATQTEYDTALRAVGVTSTKAGTLPYVIVDGYQQLVRDFATWRVAEYGVSTEKDPVRRAWIKAFMAERQQLIIRDIGVWSHFVGDAAYPLHDTLHYNGWGDGPNPQGFTTARIHVPIEGPFVGRNITLPQVAALLPPPSPCACSIETRVARYLTAGWKQVEPFYRLEKEGAFKGADPRGIAYLARRLAVGAAETRDLVVQAWNTSANAPVGYPVTNLADIKAGKTSAYDVLYSTGD